LDVGWKEVGYNEAFLGAMTIMNSTKTRSLAGPFLFIGIGALFLIHNLTEVNIFRIVWPYWPLVLIFVGVTKLVEYYKGKAADSGR